MFFAETLPKGGTPHLSPGLRTNVPDAAAVLHQEGPAVAGGAQLRSHVR